MKRKIIRDQINQAHQFAINVLGETIELINAKKELVKAETELERVRKSQLPSGGVTAHINRNPNSGNGIAAHYAGEKLRELVEEARLRQSKFVVSESTAEIHRLNARIKALEDQVRNFKVKEEPKPEEPEKKEPIKPEMRLVERLVLNKPYLAVNKQNSDARTYGVCVGNFGSDIINLKWGGADNELDYSEWHFYEFVTPEANHEEKPAVLEPKYQVPEKAHLIKKLDSALEDCEKLCGLGQNPDVVFSFKIKKYDLERLIKELKQ